MDTRPPPGAWEQWHTNYSLVPDTDDMPDDVEWDADWVREEALFWLNGGEREGNLVGDGVGQGTKQMEGTVRLDIWFDKHGPPQSAVVGELYLAGEKVTTDQDPEKRDWAVAS